MFKEGDAVRIKPNTVLENGTVVQDWAGMVEEVLHEDGYCVVLLDALTIDALEDDYLKQVLKEGGLPFLEVFKFDNLELAPRRDTEKQLKKALDQLTDRAMDLEDEIEEELTAQQEEWLTAFEQSSYYKQLTAVQKGDVEFVGYFIDTVYQVGGGTPQQWTPETIETVCLEEIPGTWITEATVFEHLGEILVAFLQFLGAEKHLQNSKELVETVQAIKEQIPIKAQDPNNWYEPKPLLMEAKEAGVDIHDSKALDAFVLAKKKSK